MSGRAAIVDRPIDATGLLDEIARAEHGAGVLFVGRVRDVNDAKSVTGIDYTSYRGMAEAELARIVHDAQSRWEGIAVAVEHRVGTLGVGEISVAIATGHAHRGAACDANRFIIEELKTRLPVWKREHYVDGSREWVAGSSAPAGETLESASEPA